MILFFSKKISLSLLVIGFLLPTLPTYLTLISITGTSNCPRKSGEKKSGVIKYDMVAEKYQRSSPATCTMMQVATVAKREDKRNLPRKSNDAGSRVRRQSPEICTMWLQLTRLQCAGRRSSGAHLGLWKY